MNNHTKTILIDINALIFIQTVTKKLIIKPYLNNTYAIQVGTTPL